MSYLFFDNLQELKTKAALSSVVIGDVCETLGYYKALDGGRAKYRIKTDSSSVDDGGYIIRINTTRVAELIIENNEINALQFGAHNNWDECTNKLDQSQWSKYDNFSIFARMMKKARALVKCNVYIPNGLYMCYPTKPGGTMLEMASGMTLRGDGFKTIITVPTFDEKTNPPYCGFCSCNNISDCTVKDIVFDGNRHLKSDGTYFGGNTSNGMWGVMMFTPTDALFENVVTQKCALAGFRVAGATRTKFDRCKCFDVGSAFIVTNAVNYFTISGCTVGGYSAGGIALIQNEKSNNIVITNNIIRNEEGSAGMGVRIGTTTKPDTTLKTWNDNVTISNNIIDNYAAGFTLHYSSHVVFTGNNVGNCVNGENAVVRNSQDVVMNDNQFYTSGNDNILLTNSSNIIINNNIIKDNAIKRTTATNSFAYLNLVSNQQVSIRGNHIYQETGTLSIQRFIRFNTFNQHIVFESNEVYNQDASGATITPVRIWFDGTKKADGTSDDCIKNSYIELPPNTDMYASYPAQTNVENSNTIFRRVDKINKYYTDNNTDELARCVLVDPTAQVFHNIRLMPVNTRMLLVFNNNRGSGTTLYNDGNIRFKETGLIPGNSNCVIELVCLGSEWVEVSRS